MRGGKQGVEFSPFLFVCSKFLFAIGYREDTTFTIDSPPRSPGDEGFGMLVLHVEVKEWRCKEWRPPT